MALTAKVNASATPFLKSRSLYLKPFDEADINESYLSWFNDPEVCAQNSHHTSRMTLDKAREFSRQMKASKTDLVLAIRLVKGDRHIGNISLNRINPVYRSAELAILLGDKLSWGKGYGKEAARLLCDHGFSDLNLHRIACGTFEQNTAMRRLAAYLGMREEGCRREAAFKNGQYVNVIEFGVLKESYLKKFHSR